jgi:nitroreductase
MRKPAENTHPIHDLLRDRWSSRAFADTPVPTEILLSVFEAARWSASTFNGQPWRFIVATKNQPHEHAALLTCLTESNQLWAKNAPVLMLTAAKLTFAEDGSPHRLGRYDVGLAVQNLVVQATALGLNLRQMAGLYPEKAMVLYEIPEDYEVLTGIAVGYYGAPERLSERQQTREQEPRTRNPLSSFIFSGTWGESAEFIPE